MQVKDGERVFLSLVNKVYAEGVSVDLERDDKVIARLIPDQQRPTLTMGEFATFLRSLPPLGDDADRFADDLRAIRAEFPASRPTGTVARNPF
jgi:antitoxin (DNA-binding transcriptional repressor) of toxin-antitoxin stability system